MVSGGLVFKGVQHQRNRLRGLGVRAKGLDQRET